MGLWVYCVKEICKYSKIGWDYNGSAQFYATCPNCKTSVPLDQSERNMKKR